MRLHEFSTKIKVTAFERCGGRCGQCTAKLLPGRFQYDHVIPLGMGGASTLDNCEVLCSACHDAKTARRDIPAIAKSNRIHAKHIGAKAPSRNPMPGSRGTRWKKRIDGSVVPR